MTWRAWFLVATVGLLGFGAGCADSADSDPSAGGNTSSAGGGGGDAGGSAAQGGGSAQGGATTQGPVASWDVTADFEVNGHPVGEAIQSASSFHRQIDGQDYLSVIVTDVPAFCAATQAGDCGTETHFRLELDLTGVTPGTYSIASGEVGAWTGDVPQSCAGAGIGADAGTVTFETVELGADGFVSVSFEVEFLTGTAHGTVVAPLCELN